MKKTTHSAAGASVPHWAASTLSVLYNSSKDRRLSHKRFSPLSLCLFHSFSDPVADGILILPCSF